MELLQDFDEPVEFIDEYGEFHKRVMLVRETLYSTSKFLMQMVSFASFVACGWLAILRGPETEYVVGLAVSFILTMANSQVMRYVGRIPYNPEEEVDIDDIS